MPVLKNFLRKKTIGHVHGTSLLHRSLTGFDLVLLGIGAIIGAGVFVLTGIAAATQAGPAVIFSYVIAGFAALLAALAYAELAAAIGGTGSAYSYVYAGFGELLAWIIAWNLLLEYLMSIATVSIGWSGYVENLFESIHLHIPNALTKNPFEGGLINLPAVLIIAVLGFLLAMGIKHSVRFNAAMVFIKLLTIFVFLIIAFGNIQLKNWENFMPFGWSGVMGGAALVFFAYIGFDALSTAVEETIHPQRNVPIGILLSLVICTLIYVLVAATLTGIVPYFSLNVRSPVSDALLRIGYPTTAGFIAAGAIAGLTTVMLVMYYGVTRIILAVALDGLLPISLAYIHPQRHTPLRAIAIVGLISVLVAGFMPIGHVAELVNIGTLTAFAFVCGGVVVFRITHPDLGRPFRLPFSPFIPLLGVIFCLYLMFNLSIITWFRFVIWTIIGFLIYFLYGIKHSLLRVKPSSDISSISDLSD